MQTFKAAFILLICSIFAGCGDYSNTDRNASRELHYSTLIDRLGEPTQVLDDGTGGKVMSWSPFPIDERDLRSDSYNSRRDVYRVNFKGIVYDRPNRF